MKKTFKNQICKKHGEFNHTPLTTGKSTVYPKCPKCIKESMAEDQGYNLSVKIRAEKAEDCRGCIFDHDDDHECIVAGNVAILLNLPNCEDGWIYKEDLGFERRHR